METTTKNSFKAVDFMRKVRNELSDLYHSDKERFHNELKKSMADFLAKRANTASKNVTQNLGKKL